MTIFHKPDAEGEFTDKEYAEHLISSECSECVKAGMRFTILLKKIELYENGMNKIIGKIPEND